MCENKIYGMSRHENTFGEAVFSALHKQADGYITFIKYLLYEPALKKGLRAGYRIFDPPRFFSQRLYYAENARFFQ